MLWWIQCYGLCVQCYGLCVQKSAIRLLQLYSNLDILYSILPMWYWINYSLDMTCTVSHLTCTFLVKHFTTVPFECLVTWESFITKRINYYKTITHSNVWLLIQSRSTYMPLEEAINISFLWILCYTIQHVTYWLLHHNPDIFTRLTGDGITLSILIGKVRNSPVPWVESDHLTKNSTISSLKFHSLVWGFDDRLKPM